MLFRLVQFTVLILILSFTQPSEARIIHIPDDYEVIQDGVDASRPGDTLLVNPGDYEHCELIISHDLTLAGEYLLTGDERTIEETVLYGDPQGTTIFVTNRQINLWLVGLRLSDGNYGLHCGADPCIYISHCLFDNNEYAIQYAGPSIVVSNSSFLDNGRVSVVSYLNYGGACSMRIQDCNFRGNSHLTLSSGITSIRHCTFINNQSGVGSSSVRGTFSDCHFEGNSSEGNGGALTLGGGSVINCTFIGNHGQNGGAIHGNGDIRQCTFIGNSSENQGGAIYISGYIDASITNCTFFANTSRAGEGGDLYFYGGEPDWEWGSRCILSNSILYNGDPQAIALQPNDSSEFTISYCDIQGGREQIAGDLEIGQFTWGEGNLDEDPLFVNPNEGDFHLTIDSPCIDTGDPESDPDPDGTRTDIGALFFHQRDIEVEPEVLEFIDVQTETVDSMAVSIRNVGLSALQITSLTITPEDTPFEVLIDEDEFEIEPEASYTTWITFAPEEEAEYQAAFIIESDDPDEEVVEIPLNGTALGVNDDEENLPLDFGITGVFPNPFNAQTIVRFSVPVATEVSLEVYDLNGRKVNTLSSGRIGSGYHELGWDASGFPAGVYFVRLYSGNEMLTRKVLLIR